MNTKNIFRMLLVAAALLLGANNVKAQYTYEVELTQGQWNEKFADKNQFTYLENGSIFRLTSSNINKLWHKLYISGGNSNDGNISYADPYFKNWDKVDFDNNTSPSPYVEDQNYIEFECTQTTVDVFKRDGMYMLIQGMDNVVITYTTTQYVPTKYSITVANIDEGGTVSVDKNKAVKDEEVTITTNIYDGYYLESLTVTDSDNNNITITGNKFTMPESNVTVTAVIKPILYNITLETVNNGTVSLSDNSSRSNAEITINATPNEGYKLYSVTIKKENGEDVNFDYANSKFYMPNQNVTIKVVFCINITDETPYSRLWSSENGQAVGWNNEDLSFSAAKIKNAEEGDVIRIYGTAVNNFQIMLRKKGNDKTIFNSITVWSNNFADGYGDMVITAEGLEMISDATELVLAGSDFTVTDVRIYKKNNDSPEPQEKQDASISFSGDVNMVFGTTFTAPEVSTTPENASLTYTTSNINVASIINNQVVPVGAGEASITATYEGNDEYNGTTATYKITVTAEVNNDALWYGAGYLGDWAAEERGSVGINIGIPDGTFASVEKGDTLRFHGKLGPLDANNWAIQLANGSWNGNIINIITGTDGFASGYYDVPVDTDELVAALKTNGSWGNCGYLQGYNLTITAITLRKYSSQVQPSETINGNWIASEQAPEAGEIIKDDDALTIRTVYDTTFGNDQSRSIHGKEFDHYITVRVDAEPSAENVTGTQKDTNTPITITAKQNTTVVFYYRRQSDNSNDWNFTANTGKDLKIVDQSEPTTLISGTLSVNNAFYNNDQVFGYVAKTYTLEAGKTYTVWAKGTTIQLYGIYYSTNANNVSVNTTYKITYYNGENIYCAIWLPSSASIPSLDTNPTKEGYTFDGWKDSDGNRLPSTMPAYDLTVYAQFTEDTPTQPVEEYIPVDMGDYEYRTYVTTRNIDFSESIGIKGYYATGLNNAGTEVQFTEVTGVVNSSVPLLLRKVEGATEYKLRISETEGVTPSPNKLVAGSSDYVGSSNIYVLTVHNGLLVFAETNYTQALVDGEHAYLDLRGSNARGRLRMSLGGNGDNTTGIEAIENEGVETNTVYDLRGQRVEKPTKGLYIINGKKVYLK